MIDLPWNFKAFGVFTITTLIKKTLERLLP